jgi:hypothetical protein
MIPDLRGLRPSDWRAFWGQRGLLPARKHLRPASPVIHSSPQLARPSDSGKLTALWLAALVIWLAALAWVRPIALPDEGRYTDIARWMAHTGDWLIPRIDGLPFLHKPPLYFWSEAGLIYLFGTAPFVARLVPLASGVGICACVFLLVRLFHGDRSARWAVAVLALNPLFYGGSQFANLDMLVAALITVTITCAVLAAQSNGRSHLLWLGAYVAAALAVLAKGLIGVVLPALVFIGWALALRRFDLLTRALSLIGVAVFCAIVLPWFLAVEQEFPGFLRYFVGYHHFARYLQGDFNNSQGIWFYPVVLLLGAVPWTIALLANWRSVLAERQPSPLQTLGLVWFSVVMVFFSLPRSKLVGYIFPLLPAFAIMAGPWFAKYRHRQASAAIGAMICIVAVFVASHVGRTGPIGIAATFKTQIAPEDDVVFLGGYLFDVAVVLDRRAPSYVTDDWSRRAAELPDNIRRQFTEGREFDPKSGYVLIGRQNLKPLLAANKRVWVWAEKAALAGSSDLGELAVVAHDDRFVLLRTP